jgi:hypothetical protein
MSTKRNKPKNSVRPRVGKNKPNAGYDTLSSYQLGSTEHDMTYEIKEDGTVKFLTNPSSPTKKTASQSRLPHPQQDEVRKITHHFVVCPDCKQLVSAANLDNHREKVHGSKLIDLSTPYKQFFCPICRAKIKSQAKLEKHLRLVHNQKEPQTLMRSTTSQPQAQIQLPPTIEKKPPHPVPTISIGAVCPICQVKLKSQTRLQHHLSKVHPDSGARRKTQIKIKHVPDESLSRQPRKGVVQLSRWLTGGQDPKLVREAFRQAFDEPRDGSKGLGHMEREWDGKFGSFPLHDDYDDESDSE